MLALALATLAAVDPAGAPWVTLRVDGACPSQAELADAVARAVGRVGVAPPEHVTLGMDVRASGSTIDVEIKGGDGQVALRRSLRDDGADCGARADAVGLVLARYVEGLGARVEPPAIRVRPAPRSRVPWWLELDGGPLADLATTGASGSRALSPGAALGVRAGFWRYAASLRAGWLPHESYEPSPAGSVVIDRFPLCVSLSRVADLPRRLRVAAGPRAVAEIVHIDGRPHLASATKLDLRVGVGGDVTRAIFGPWFAGAGVALDVGLRTGLHDGRITAAGRQAAEVQLWIPSLWLVAGARWNL